MAVGQTVRARALAKHAKTSALTPLRTALLGTSAAVVILTGPTASPALAACNAPVPVSGALIINCSGTMTGTNVPAISYSNTTQSFEILSGATITTTGANAYGIYGYAEGPYGLINSTGSIKTTGDNAHGIYLQVANSLGLAQFEGSISTSGASAHGIVVSATGATAAYAGILSKATIATTGAEAHGLYATTTVGAPAMNATPSDSIQILSRGAITTQGYGARGIFADNIRGGAGNDGVSIRSTAAISTYGHYAEAILARSDSAGDVKVTSEAAIRTAGTQSHGIHALSGTPTGAQGNVAVTSSGSITTAGAQADGIRALTFAPNSNVSVTVGGNITTTGTDSTAITAAAYMGNVNISVGAGATLTSSGGAGTILASGTNVTITNAGTINGNIYSASSTGTINNAISGTLNSGADIGFMAVGAPTISGTLNNSGTVSPGGTGTLRTTTLTGDFVQSASGRLAVDTSWQTGASDRLVVTGTATIAGLVIVNPINLGSQAGLTRSFTILTAAGGITDNGITVANTAAATYAIAKPDANTLNVNATIDFKGNAGTVLDANQRSVANALNTTFGAGNSLGFMPVLLMFGQRDYAAALTQLAPTGDASMVAGTLQTGNTFANQLLSCRVAGEHGEANRFIREGQCVWARIGARRLESEGRSDSIGYGETSTFFSAGAQLKLHGDWRIGAGIGYEQAKLTTDTHATSQTDRLHLGGVVKYNPGPWLLAASVTGGHGWHDNRRSVAFGGFSSVATADSESNFVAGRLTAAYLMSRGNWYLKPQIEVASTRLMRDSYTEHAAGGAALRVGRSDFGVASVSPSVEVGTEHSYHGTMYRAFIRGGASFRDKDTFVTTASFADAASAAPFTTATRIDRMTADIGAGVDVLIQGSTNVRLQYDGQFGERTTSHSGSTKVSVPF